MRKEKKTQLSIQQYTKFHKELFALIIFRKIELVPPTPDSMIPVDCCQKYIQN